MQTTQSTSLSKHLAYEYTSFDRVVLRGYIQGLFVEGSVINLLRNLGFKEHSNGVEKLGLCYLKLSSYLPLVSEFYFNGHNYLKKQFDLIEIEYTMKENSFTKISDINKLNSLVSGFKPSIALERINHWMDVFFRFDQGSKSTRSKLLHHNWFSYQTEICTNLIFKSPKFANAYFEKILAKHHTIGLPDKLTEIFSLSRQKDKSKHKEDCFPETGTDFLSCNEAALQIFKRMEGIDFQFIENKPPPSLKNRQCPIIAFLTI